MISKILADQLKIVLDEVISPNQSAFIHGWLISDNFFIGFEGLHAINNLRGRNKGIIALKLDMSRAYDHVELAFP